MNGAAPRQWLDEYVQVAQGTFERAEQFTHHELKKDEAKQLNRWLQFHGEEEVLKEGRILSRNDLKGWLGFGIWRVDHLSEWISVLCMRSNYESVERMYNNLIRAGQLMHVPLRQGTIGYVAEKATSLADGLYIVEDCEADLRGTVAVEDRWLGNLNAIVVPVVSFRKGLHRVHAVFWLFHPIPRLFTRDYAKKFAEAVQPLGQELGHFFEATRYRHLIQSIQTTAQSERSRGPARVSLDEKLREILTRITHINKEDKIRGIRLPWVALLHCTPGQPFDIAPGAGIQAWSPLKTWVEPNSFMNSRQKKMSERLIRAYNQDKQFLPQVKMLEKIDFPKKCEWGDDDVCDLVLPLPDGDTICGFVRVHLSTYLLNDDSDRWHDVARCLEHDLHELGTAIGVLRSEYNQNFREKKVEREWEQTLFGEFFHAILTNVSIDLRWRLNEICKVLWEQTNATSTKSAEARLVNILCSVTEKLRPLNLCEECVLGISYWSCSEEMQLVERPPGELDDLQLLRDLQRALTLLITPGNRRRNETVVTWPDGGLEGRIEVGGTDVDGIPCYFHLELTSIGTENKRQRFNKLWITPTKTGHYDVGFSQPGGETRELRTRWQLCPQVSMIRTWHIRQSTGELEAEPLATHLDLRHKARSQRMRPALEALQQWWDPRDGLDYRAIPFELDKQRDKLPQSGLIWREPDEGTERTALRTLLFNLAPEAIDDLSHIWAFPVQIIDHIYYWLLIGVTHRLGEGEKELFDLVLGQIQVQIERLAAKIEIETVRTVFLSDDETRDYKHNLVPKVTNVEIEITRLIESGASVTQAQLEGLRNSFRHVAWWVLSYASEIGSKNPTNAYYESSLLDLLTRAARLGSRKNSTDILAAERRLKKMVESLKGNAQGVKIAVPTRVQYGLLIQLWADLLNNADRHGEGPDCVRLEWDPKRCTLSIENDVDIARDPKNTSSEGRLDVMRRYAAYLNRILVLPAPQPIEGDLPGLGLRSVASAVSRLRLGIRVELPATAPYTWTVSVYLRRLVRS